MSISVFVPGHITCFFNIENHENPLKNGSCGGGFLLSKGVTTTIKETNNSETSIKINGQIDLRNETIIRKVLDIMNIDEGFEINQEISLPIGAGFGTSAAAALGTAIGINNLLSLENTLEKSGQIAHLAEIALGSGLGDVIAELGQGVVLRTKAGAPGIGEITSLNEYNYYIGCKTFSQINTSSIIQDKNYKNIISKNGLIARENFLKDMSFKNFLKQSYNFSKDTKLMSDDVENLVKYFNHHEELIGSSMAMLGNTVFTIAENKKTLKNLKINNLEIYKINNKGIS